LPVAGPDALMKATHIAAQKFTLFVCHWRTFLRYSPIFLSRPLCTRARSR
jgi:hypothetical protein